MTDSEDGSVSENVVLLLKSNVDAENDKYEQIFRNHGFRTVHLPVLRFEFVNGMTLQEKLSRPDEYCCLVFTSQRAVEGVGKSCRDLSVMEPWKSNPVYAVGQSTMEAVRRLGLNPRGWESGNADNLLLLINQDELDKTRPVLFPCGNLRRETLPTGLRGSGFQVDDVTVYQTSAHPNIDQRLREIIDHVGIPEFACFFSPSGVRYCREIFDKLHLVQRVKMISMGKSTTCGLQECQFPVAGEAEHPCPESVLRALLNVKSGRHDVTS